MPASITNFIQGSCFGYYTENDNDCIRCKFKKGCSKATSSKEVDEVRKVFKITKKIVEDLNKKYSE